MPSGAPSASAQSNTSPEPGAGESTRIALAPYVDGPFERTGRRRRTPGSRTAPAPRRTRVVSAVSWPCSCAARRPAVCTISTTRSAVSSRKTPTVITSGGRRRAMSRATSRRDLPARRREHEADGIGAEGDGEERVVLVGDAADLDEHRGAVLGVDETAVVEVVVGGEVEQAMAAVVEQDHPLGTPPLCRERLVDRGPDAVAALGRRQSPLDAGRTASRPRTPCPAGTRAPPSGPCARGGR